MNAAADHRREELGQGDEEHHGKRDEEKGREEPTQGVKDAIAGTSKVVEGVEGGLESVSKVLGEVKGGPVTFTVRVTNLSDKVVILGCLIDDLFGDLLSPVDSQVSDNLCPTIDTRLDPEEVVECTFVGVVLPVADGGAHENTVTALVFTGIDPFASASGTVVVEFGG